MSWLKRYSICICVLSIALQASSGRKLLQAHFTPINTNTGSSAIYLCKGNGLAAGDEVALLTTDDLVLGCGVVESGNQAVITAWGDDSVTPEKDGALEGEVLTLMYWSSTTGEEKELIPDKITNGLTGDIITGEPCFHQDGAYILDVNALPAIEGFCISAVGDAILLSWNAASGSSGYHVYRGTSYDFTPAAENRIGDNINDQDGGTSGVQFTDNNIGGANVVGDVNMNYFYRVCGVYPDEGPKSSCLGEFDYDLVTTTGTNINELVLIFDTGCWSTPLTTAEQLAQAIPNCTNVYQWSATGQGSVGHPKDTPINDFTLQIGHPYMVHVTSPTVWSITGSWPGVQFDLIATTGTDINHIGLPFNKASCTNAEELAQNIAECTNVYYWDAAGQGTVGHPKDTPINTFSVKVGYPYYVNVTANSTWPEALLKGRRSISEEVIEPKVTISGRHTPHSAFGRLQGLSRMEQEGSLELRAWIRGREEEVLSENSVGSYLDRNYWAVSVGNFRTAWQAGEWLQVEIKHPAAGFIGRAELCLTTEGADEKSITLSPESPAGINLPNKVMLYNNYPNPFNPSTEIRYGLPSSMHVRICIYDIAGRLVKELLSDFQPPGFHRVSWDGTNAAGGKIVSGVYLCQLQSGGMSWVHKLIYAK